MPSVDPALSADVHGEADADAGRRSPALAALAALLLLEALGVAGAAIFLGWELAHAPAHSFASSVALIVLVAVGAMLLAGVAWAAWRRRPWIRGAAITWQVLQLAAAWVFLEGDLATWAGWALAATAVLGLVLALAPSTRRALAPRGR